MRKFKGVIILAVVFVLLIGVYFYLDNRPDAEQPIEEDERIRILDLDRDEIEKIVLKSEEGVLTLLRGDEEWYTDYPIPLELDQSKINGIARTLSSLYAEHVVEENATDLSKYGLDNPSATGEAFYKDGSKITLYLGNKTAEGNTWYLMAEGDPNVYTVWSNQGNNLRTVLGDLRDRSLAELNLMEISYMKIYQKGNPTIEIVSNKSMSDEEARFGLGLWRMVQPYEEPMGVSGENMQNLLEAFPDMQIKDFIDDNPEDLSIYGLDDPEAEFIIKDNENTLHLIIGFEHDDDSVYFKEPGSDSVYTISKRNLEFMDVKAFTLVEKFSYIVFIDDVDSIDIIADGVNHTLTIDREIEEAEDEDEEDTVITTYKVNGSEVSEKAFKKFYQSLIGLMVDSESTEELEENPEVRTIFHLNKGSEREVHVNYVPYNRDFYAAFRSGRNEFLVSRVQVNKMLEDLQALIRGDLIEE